MSAPCKKGDMIGYVIAVRAPSRAPRAGAWGQSPRDCAYAHRNGVQNASARNFLKAGKLRATAP